MSINNFVEYVREHTWDNKDIFFTSNALGGELGEVQNVLKKEQAYIDFPNYGYRVDKEVLKGIRTSFREQFVDESGDLLFYYLQMLNKKGVSLEEVITAQVIKINKQSESHGQIYKK